MPVEITVKVGKVGNSLKVTIPQEMTYYLDIKEGDMLGLTLTDKQIVLRKLPKPTPKK
jgi:antitoxin component of MazEF toxin-antitoxin module